MAKGKFTGGRHFEKGNPGGPGRPKMPPDVKQAHQLSQNEIALILSELIKCDLDQLKAKLRDPKARVFDLAIASVLKFAIEKGDQMRIDFILNRLIGKVREPVDVSGNINVVVKDYLTDET